ncbi:MAG: S1C family serine protease [Woeseiaceae bacterium]
MFGARSALLFILQSIVVGLAVAFLVVLFRPDLLPTIAGNRNIAPASFADAVEISAPSVASVYTKRLIEYSSSDDERPRFRIETSAGSAVVIDPEGYLVTNFHVIEAVAEINVLFSDGRFSEPEVIGVDAETDLALLKVDLGEIPSIPLGSSGQVRVGDIVLAIGNPYGLSKSVTQGIVSATGRGEIDLNTFENYIQTDAAINAGNSGGPLINVRGEMVGINTAVLQQDSGTEGISFAIPVDLVRGVVEELKLHGRVMRGWMGFRPDEQDLTAAERLARGIEGNAGILLDFVYINSPAEAAGLMRGDVILAINGEPIYSQRQARLLVAGTSPGDSVDIVGVRDEEEFAAKIIVTERPPDP